MKLYVVCPALVERTFKDPKTLTTEPSLKIYMDFSSLPQIEIYDGVFN